MRAAGLRHNGGIEPFLLKARGKVRRTGHAEGKQRLALPSGAAPGGHVRRDGNAVFLRAARLYGLDGKGLHSQAGKGGQKARRHRRLAGVGIRAGKEKGAHQATPRVRIMARSASKDAPGVVR